MKKILLCLFILLSATIQAQKIKVACVGNSVTYGHGIEDREKNSYPTQLQRMLGERYEVVNFGKVGQRYCEGDTVLTTSRRNTRQLSTLLPTGSSSISD